MIAQKELFFSLDRGKLKMSFQHSGYKHHAVARWRAPKLLSNTT